MALVAILVAAIAGFIIGALWYGPLFGKPWMRLMNYKKKDLEKSPKTNYVWGFLAAVVTATALYVIAGMVAAKSNLNNVWIATGIVWLGFVAMPALNGPLWERKPMGVYWIGIFYELVRLFVMTTVIVLIA